MEIENKYLAEEITIVTCKCSIFDIEIIKTRRFRFSCHRRGFLFKQCNIKPQRTRSQDIFPNFTIK